MHFTVIFISALFGILALVPLSFIKTNVDQEMAAQAGSRHYQQMSSIAESARAEILGVMRDTGLNPTGLIKILQCQQSGAECAQLSLYNLSNIPDWAVRLSAPHAPLGFDTKEKVQFLVTVDPGGNRTLSAHVTSDVVGYRPRDIQLRVGAANPFTNALTGNKFDCVMCHMTVMGPVASYGPLHLNVPHSTQIHGTFRNGGPLKPSATVVFSQGFNQSVPGLPISDYQDPRSPNPDFVSGPSLANPYAPPPPGLADGMAGMWLTRIFVRNMEYNYVGEHLPYNLVRQERILPKLEPAVMQKYSTGTLAAPLGKLVAKGADYAAGPLLPVAINSTVDGQVILNGRDAGPIVVNGRVFISGDVILFGKLSGQGEIIAGGNIYIADDLSYVNPPPHFSGSAEANAKMTLVEKNYAALAVEMKDYDRVALMATNNIVVGDPFQDDFAPGPTKNVPPAPLELGVTQIAQMLAYDGQIAIDTTTGYQLDAELVKDINGNPTGEACFLKPWESLSNCIPTSSPQASDIAIPKVSLYNMNPSEAPTDYEYLVDHSGARPSEAYKSIFYPHEYRSKKSVNWISASDFLSVTKNNLKYTDLMTPGPYGEFKRYIRYTVTLPYQNIFAVSKFKTSEIVNEIEQALGVKQALKNLPADNFDSTLPVPGKKNGWDWLNETVDNFIGAVQGDPARASWLPLNPLPDATRFNVHATGLYQTLDKEVGSNAGTPGSTLAALQSNPFIYGAHARLVLDPTATDGSPYKGTAAQQVIHMAMSRSNNALWLPHEICRDGAKLPDYVGPDTPDHYSLSCTMSWDGTKNSQVAKSDYKPFANGYFSVDMAYENAAQSAFARAEVLTRVYDKTKIRWKNPIHNVDALLFANHFIYFAGSQGVDSEMRVHGGVIAKDMFGLMMNRHGFDRSDSGSLTTVPPEASSYFLMLERNSPSLWVTLDPRFQYVSDLIGSDFLKIDGFQ